MKQNKKNEELQSRREFFKKAAKGALPILGAIALANVPLLSSAADSQNGCSRYGCGVCTSGCSGACKGGCYTTCSGGCKHYACKGVNKN